MSATLAFYVLAALAIVSAVIYALRRMFNDARELGETKAKEEAERESNRVAKKQAAIIAEHVETDAVIEKLKSGTF